MTTVYADEVGVCTYYRRELNYKHDMSIPILQRELLDIKLLQVSQECIHLQDLTPLGHSLVRGKRLLTNF